MSTGTEIGCEKVVSSEKVLYSCHDGRVIHEKREKLICQCLGYGFVKVFLFFFFFECETVGV